MNFIKNKLGFTLVETILTVALMGAIGGVLGFTLKESIKSYSLLTSRKSTISEIRAASSRIKSDLILIANTDAITSFSSSMIQFNLSTETGISYSLTGTNLMRKTAILASNINSLTFTYYDSSGNSTLEKASIKKIRMAIQFKAENNFGVYDIVIDIIPRNFYYDTFREIP